MRKDEIVSPERYSSREEALAAAMKLIDEMVVVSTKTYTSREEALAAAMKLIDEIVEPQKTPWDVEPQKTPWDIVLYPLDVFNRFLEKCWNVLLELKK